MSSRLQLGSGAEFVQKYTAVTLKWPSGKSGEGENCVLVHFSMTTE